MNAPEQARVARELAARIAGVRTATGGPASVRFPQPVLAARPVPEAVGIGAVVGVEAGATVAVTGRCPGAVSVGLGVAAQVLGRGWCAVVGFDQLGVVAAAEHGVAVERLVVVRVDAARWVWAVAAAVDGFGLVLARPPVGLPAVQARRLSARARARGCVLVVLGSWEGATARVEVSQAAWEPGTVGRLVDAVAGRRVRMRADGGGRRRDAWLQAPSVDGGVQLVEPERYASAVGGAR